MNAVVLNKKCSWCGDPVMSDQPKSNSYDGELMHFICAAQADDDEPYISD